MFNRMVDRIETTLMGSTADEVPRLLWMDVYGSHPDEACSIDQGLNRGFSIVNHLWVHPFRASIVAFFDHERRGHHCVIVHGWGALRQAFPDLILRGMREDRLRHDVVKVAPKLIDRPIVGPQEGRPLERDLVVTALCAIPASTSHAAGSIP